MWNAEDAKWERRISPLRFPAGYLPCAVSQAGVWVWQFRALLGYRSGRRWLTITMPPFSNAHTRAYSSACELETGPPIKGIYYSFARPRKEEGPRGHLGRDEGIIRYFFSHSSAGSVEGKMCMRRALGVPAPGTRDFQYLELESEI